MWCDSLGHGTHNRGKPAAPAQHPAGSAVLRRRSQDRAALGSRGPAHGNAPRAAAAAAKSRRGAKPRAPDRRGGVSDQRRHCTVCNDPALCERHGLMRPVMGRPQAKCALADDEPGAAFVYRVLLRLADRQGVDVSELLREEA